MRFIKRSLLALLFAVSFALAQAQTFVGIPKEKFDYVAASQHNGNWCWAATIQMVMNYYNIPVTQEDIVKKTFGTNRYGELPDLPASHEVMTENLNAVGRLKKIQADLYYGVPETAYLIEQLKLERPVLISYETGEETEHAVIITGISYLETPYGPELQSIIVRDPWPGTEKQATLGRVEYGPRFQSLITAYWDLRIGPGNQQQYVSRNNSNNSHTTTVQVSRTQLNTSSTYTERPQHRSSTSAASASDKGSVRNSSLPKTAAPASSPYSVSR